MLSDFGKKLVTVAHGAKSGAASAARAAASRVSLITQVVFPPSDLAGSAVLDEAGTPPGAAASVLTEPLQTLQPWEPKPIVDAYAIHSWTGRFKSLQRFAHWRNHERKSPPPSGDIDTEVLSSDRTPERSTLRRIIRT